MSPPSNPVQRLLDEWRIPWRESQEALIARHGIQLDPWWGRPSIVLVPVDPPPIAGLLRPLHFEPRAKADPAMPPLCFSGWVWARRGRWFRSRAMASLLQVYESLVPLLGEGGNEGSSNTRGYRWRFGPASALVRCFPPLLNLDRSTHPLRRVEPRVLNSCWIELVSGYRPTCSTEERSWIDSFEAEFSFGVGGGNLAAMKAAQPRQEVLDFVREPIAGTERAIGRMGRSPDGGTLIFGSDQLYFVPTAAVDHVALDRAHPARGGGYSSLSLACRSLSGAQCFRHVPLARDADTWGLDDLARRIADCVGRPCQAEDFPDE